MEKKIYPEIEVNFAVVDKDSLHINFETFGECNNGEVIKISERYVLKDEDPLKLIGLIIDCTNRFHVMCQTYIMEKEICECKRDYKSPLSGICELCWDEKYPDEEETIKEAAYQARRNYQDEVGKDGMNDCIMFDAMKIQRGFQQGAKWQQERMYSEEEVIKILDKREDYLGTEPSIFDYLTNKEWFEQFKKK